MQGKSNCRMLLLGSRLLPKHLSRGLWWGSQRPATRALRCDPEACREEDHLPRPRWSRVRFRYRSDSKDIRGLSDWVPAQHRSGFPSYQAAVSVQLSYHSWATMQPSMQEPPCKSQRPNKRRQRQPKCHRPVSEAVWEGRHCSPNHLFHPRESNTKCLERALSTSSTFHSAAAERNT